MLNDSEIAYYSRQILIEELGVSGQQKLKEAKVLVIGAGGLGCPVLQYLTGAGVGTLGIVDGDVVSVSNLHRQLLFGQSSIGKQKSDEAKKRLEDLNPHCTIVSFPFFLTAENSNELINSFDIIVDCSDNYPTRYLVNDLCVLNNKPLVYGSIYRFEGQVSVFNYQGGPTYRCLFKDLPTAESTTNCAASGVLGVLPGMIGLLQANEVIKLITGLGTVLSGKVLVFNALRNSFTQFQLERDQTFDYSRLFGSHGVLKENYPIDCVNDSFSVNEISATQVLAMNNSDAILFLDVRQTHEVPEFKNDKVMQLPLDQLPDNVERIPSQKTLIVFCRSGNRSRKASEHLQRMGYQGEIYNLEGGITEEFITVWKTKQKK